MAKDLPFFKWYPADAETDEVYRAMTDAEVGFYHRCLNLAWINNGLPADPAERARLLGRNRRRADANWTERVASRFSVSSETGKLVNRRQAEELQKARERAVSRLSVPSETAEKGLRGHAEQAEKARKKTQVVSESTNVPYERSTEKNENVAIRASNSISDSSVSSEKTANSATGIPNTTTGIHSDSLSFNGKISASTSTEKVKPDTGSTTRFNGNSLLDDFGTFLEAVTECELPASKDLQEKASFEWRRLDFGQKQLAIKGLRDRKAAGEFDDPRYRPHPHNYLSNQSWLRPVRSRSNGTGHRINLAEEVKKAAKEGFFNDKR